MNRSFFHVLLFLASMIVAGSLLFGLSGCSKQEQPKPAKQPGKVATQPTPAPPVVPLPISVDFDNMALSSVAQFVTAQTGKGFILTGLESKPVTWIESGMSKNKIFDSFKSALTASGLLLKPAQDTETLFTIEKPEEPKVPVRLDFAASRRGTFFLLGSTVYPETSFPYPVQYEAGHYFAMVPKTTADQLTTTKQPESPAM